MAADILTLTAEEFAKWNSENPYVAPQPAAEPAPGQAAETGIPKRFQDYQGADFSLDGFNALNPFQQAQIQGVLGGMIGRYKNPLYTDPYDDEDNGVGNWTSSEKYELRKPQGNDEWSAFLAEFYPERSKFLGGSTYGVQDEMRYIHSLFDDENMQIPDEPAAIADEVAPAEVADAPDTTEEEVVEEEQDMLRIMTNAPTTVPKDNVSVKTNQPTADKGGTQGYKKDRNNTLAKIVQPKNLNMSI